MDNSAARIWLTTEQGAARGQVGKRQLYRAVAAGKLKGVRVGGRRQLRFKPEWIDEWLETCVNVK